MQNHIQTIVQHFFRKSSLHEVAEGELQEFTNEYPYAIIGQFLLAEKMRHDNQEAFHDQALRTSLYFNNPAWLYWQLQEHQESDLQGLTAAINMVDEPLEHEKEVVAHTESGTGDITAIENRNIAAAPSFEDPAVEHKNAVASKPAAPAQSGNADTPPQPVINEIGFDPYHTIDYFASQGIKLKLEELAKDKLGQQLKSFTEWLRSMKRVGPAAISSATLDDNTHQAIQSIADTSVEGKDIVTEAMAEVWVKQGNYRKAIAIYEKLSLQNPLKSPYFADRIQQLKAL